MLAVRRVRCLSSLSDCQTLSFPPARFPAREWCALRRKEAGAEGQTWRHSPRQGELQAFLDYRWPGEWFPQARARGPRTIHCHVGPTNSGKTHSAMQKLMSATRGVYCAPLRLLAMEMWERLNAAGKRCGLRTGEFSAGPPDEPATGYADAPLLACTSEMLDLEREFDVAIIDEIQLVADEQRGWAFTQALLGVNARDVYVCGEEAAVQLVAKIAESLGERTIVHRYERLSPLTIDERSLDNQLAQLRPGDCVVSFSRNSIFKIKEEIESTAGTRCAVVYGSLPMENRTLQARKFNAREDGYQIMVASDAIGMGLNLNIQRIVFAQITQAGGNGHLAVPPSRIKQIAGRAGRFGFANGGNGVVTCLREADLDYVRECMETPNEEYLQAGIQPLPRQYEELHRQFPEFSLCTLLAAIREAGKFDAHYFPAISQDMQMLAHCLRAFPKLSISDQITLACAPVHLKCHFNINTFRLLAEHVEQRRKCPLEFDMRTFSNPATFLGVVESFYKALDLYLWLSTRYPKVFIDRGAAIERRAVLTELVTKLLTRITRAKRQPLDKGMGDLASLDKLLDRLKSL